MGGWGRLRGPRRGSRGERCAFHEMTNASVRWRLVLLGLAVGLMGALIVVVTLD